MYRKLIKKYVFMTSTYIKAWDRDIDGSNLLQLQIDHWTGLDGLDQVDVGGDVKVCAGDNVEGVGCDINCGSSDIIGRHVITELISNLLLNLPPQRLWNVKTINYN